MATQVLMPALSPTMEEGTLAKWLVKEGDTVKSGQILAEIETDKATMEFEAVDEGKIGKILIAEGSQRRPGNGLRPQRHRLLLRRRRVPCRLQCRLQCQLRCNLLLMRMTPSTRMHLALCPALPRRMR